jgi:phosphatidylinositol-3-phosphatase
VKAAPWLAPAAAAGLVAGLVVTGCGSPSPAHLGHTSASPVTPAPATAPAPAASAAAVAPPAHTVIVMMENHSYGEVIGNGSAPFLNDLARRGALFTNSHAIGHPSEPNYLALFSGSTHGITDDSCPLRFTGPSLASELIAAGHSFAGYAEGLPGTGSPVCDNGEYARKHVPWVNFTSVPASVSKPFTAFPAGNFSALPTVSFVIPNLCHDMHDCPVATGDAWVRAHIGPYASWAMTHHSLLIVDWDENDGSPGNQITTIFAGQMVHPGRYGQAITHYGVLRTIENLYQLPPLGRARTAHSITAVWK